jgi:NitT/TauT family transport system permease protein
MKKPQFWGIHANPNKHFKVFLAIVPFLIVLGVYFTFVEIRHAENPADKILPSLSQMSDAVERVAFTEDRRTGDYLLWKDTLSSLFRLSVGLGLSTIAALLLGLNMGAFPGLTALGLPFLTFLSMIPPLAILPILFISFGIGETGKIALIFLGTFPFIARDITMSVHQIPKEQVTKALTLGASQMAVIYRVILPQIMPRLIAALRLSLGAAWLFLIAAEAIAATEGLGYRIFLVRRYLSMDIIIPYVLWITLIGFVFDYTLKTVNKVCFPWYSPSK